ncbi:MAG: molybdopterin-dependent oxidoreductase, partial [Acidobacteriaceae bacterium]
VLSPLSLSIEEIRSRQTVSQVITQSCISNEIGGDLISTALFTGVRLKDLLAEAGLQRGAQEISIEAVDGYYESVPMEEAMDERTLLVYAMNGVPLPVEHGFPLRIYIPNHYGMKQPKWITRLEVIDHKGKGYWVDRGWNERAFVKTTSVVDSVSSDGIDLQKDPVPVGGIAFAGERGISKVEVQVDGGPWEEAELRVPALSPLTWVLWRYDWRAEVGQHTFRVRAYDGSGALQEIEPHAPHPDGATGIHSKSVRI